MVLMEIRDCCRSLRSLRNSCCQQLERVVLLGLSRASKMNEEPMEHAAVYGSLSLENSVYSLYTLPRGSAVSW